MNYERPATEPSLRPLGEIVTFLDHKRRPVREAERNPGPYPYYGANGIQGTIDGYLFDEPLVLLAEDGGHFDDPEKGIAYRISGKSWVNNHAHVLKPGPGIDCAYLARSLENRDVTSYISGTTRAKLTKGQAEKILVPVPSLPEQRRIAAILDHADALRAKRRAALAQFDNLTQAIFSEMFGDPRNSNFISNTLERICIFSSGNAWPSSGFSTDRVGLPIIRIQNVDSTERAFVYWANHYDDRFLVYENDILLTLSGSFRAEAWKGPKSLLNQRVAILRPRAGIEPAWFLLSIKRLLGKIEAVGRHALVNNVALSDLKVLELRVPPKALQTAFEERYRSLTNLKAKAEASAIALDALFASLQHRAFRGEL